MREVARSFFEVANLTRNVADSFRQIANLTREVADPFPEVANPPRELAAWPISAAGRAGYFFIPFRARITKWIGHPTSPSASRN
jgi:hypothetical protein